MSPLYHTNQARPRRAPTMTPSEREASRIRGLFQEVELPEILDVDFRTLTPEQIAQLLPPFGGEHPTKGILVDQGTGKGYGIASGIEPDKVTYNGIAFQ